MSWFVEKLNVYHREDAIDETEVGASMGPNNPFINMVGDLEDFEAIRIEPLNSTTPIIEVIDVGDFKIFGVRNIADMDKLVYGEEGENGYIDNDRVLAQDDNIEKVGYICRGPQKWDRYGNEATYLPIMRSRFKYEEIEG